MAEPKMLYDVIQDEKTHELRDHLRNHLTDGRWRDDCIWCPRRRMVSGGETHRERN